MKRALVVMASAIAMVSCQNSTKSVVVENSSDRAREEVVEFNAEVVAQTPDFIITDADGKQVTYQKTSDGKVIFMAKVAAKSSSTYTLAAGKADEFATVACGKQYPERVDDIAWENDKSAYRLYGPALQAKGEKAYGYDVWVKNCVEPVVEQRYAMELNPETVAAIATLKTDNPDSAAALYKTVSYHVDHGNGLDCYKVGPTLGGGAAALMIGDSIAYPYCYKEYEITDNGPLRFAVKLTYNTENITGEEVTEYRTIICDAGSNLNKTIIEYKGLTKEQTIVAGPVLHDADGGTNAANKEMGYVGYADPTDNVNNGNGIIYVGAVFTEALNDAKVVMFSEEEAATRGANGHILGMSTYKPEAQFVYYWGGGWSKYGFNDFGKWEEYLKTFAQNVKKPLKVTVK
jgi:hypothetical protein